MNFLMICWDSTVIRMGSTEFDDLLNEIAEDIMRMDTVMRDSVPGNAEKQTGGHSPLSRIR